MLIKESPDQLYVPFKKTHIMSSDRDAISFGIYNNNMLISKPGMLHNQILLYDNDQRIYLERSDFIYPGRIWLNSKIISFWVYPKKPDLIKIVKELESQLKIRILNSDYKIEIIDYNNKFNLKYKGCDINDREDGEWFCIGDTGILIPIKDYIGSDQRSRAELDGQHIITPKIKSFKKVPKGMGSKKKYSDSRPGETIAQNRYRMYAESILEWDEFIETLEYKKTLV